MSRFLIIPNKLNLLAFQEPSLAINQKNGKGFPFFPKFFPLRYLVLMGRENKFNLRSLPPILPLPSRCHFRRPRHLVHRFKKGQEASAIGKDYTFILGLFLI
jgi:hypothetical protein